MYKWRVSIRHLMTSGSGLMETTYVTVPSLEGAKVVYQTYLKRARRAAKKLTSGRYNRKQQERSYGSLDTDEEIDTIIYTDSGDKAYHVYVTKMD